MKEIRNIIENKKKRCIKNKLFLQRVLNEAKDWIIWKIQPHCYFYSDRRHNQNLTVQVQTVKNAWVIFKTTPGSNISRRNSILKLGDVLRKKYTEKESEVIRQWTTPEVSSKRKSCQIKRCKDSKTNTMCKKCLKYLCGLRTTQKEINTILCELFR